MAARKKRAAKKAATKTTGETTTATETVVNVVKSAAQAVGVTSQADTDPRPAAWREILIAYANGNMPPRDLRVMMDDRFTGKTAQTMVKALMFVDYSPEDAVDAILTARIAEAKAKGEKHTETL